MKDQHTKIKGYRDLSQAEIDLMNRLKAAGATFGGLLTEVKLHLVNQQIAAEGNDEEKNRIAATEPARWLAMARSDLQVALMKAVRAVAQPTDGC